VHKLQTKHKTQDTKHKQNTEHKQNKKMEKTQYTNKYRDLEERTTEYAKTIVGLCKSLTWDRINDCLIGQIVRSAGSVGANYREANEALGKKDFVYRLRVARKEAKETQHWLELIKEANPAAEEKLKSLFKETQEIRNILSAIIEKASTKL